MKESNRKKTSEATKKKISQALKGRKHDEARRAAIRQGVANEPNRKQRLHEQAVNGNAKLFEMILIETGKVVYRGYSKQEAANQLNCNHDHIKQVIMGTRKTIMGRYIAYRLDITEEDIEKTKQRRERQKKRSAERSRTKMVDMGARLKRDLRSRLAISVRYSGRYKSGSSIELLGCSIEELMKHLESKFQPGMTWENRGLHGWHIDHIIPLASIDVSDIEQLSKVCHYTNLQPLWAIDNYRKGGRPAPDVDFIK